MTEKEESQARVLGYAIQVGEDVVILNKDQTWQLFLDLCKVLEVKVSGIGSLTPSDKDAIQ